MIGKDGSSILGVRLLARCVRGAGLGDPLAQAVEVTLVFHLVLLADELEGPLGLRQRLVMEAVGEERPGEGVAGVSQRGRFPRPIRQTRHRLGCKFDRRSSEAQSESDIGFLVPAPGPDEGAGAPVEGRECRVAS